MEQAPKKGTSSLTYRTTTESLKWSITQNITAISVSIFDSHSPKKINDHTIGAYLLSCTLMLPFPKTAEASNWYYSMFFIGCLITKYVFNEPSHTPLFYLFFHKAK